MGKVINHYKVEKHFHLKMSNDQFSDEGNREPLETEAQLEAQLDRIYLTRTSVTAEVLDEPEMLNAYTYLR